MRKGLSLAFVCIFMLHSPDGGSLWLQGDFITVIQKVSKYQDHMALGSNTILHMASGRRWIVRETEVDILLLIKECK